MKIKAYTQKEKNEKVFETKVTGNRESFRLNIKVVKNDKVVHEEQGNSFVANFMRMLAQQFAIGPLDESYDFDGVLNPGSAKVDAWTLSTVLDNTVGDPPTMSWADEVTVTGWPASNKVSLSHLTNRLSRTNQIRNSHKLYIPSGQNKGVYTITGYDDGYILDGLNADPSDDIGMLVIPVVPFNPQMGTGPTHLRAWKILLGGDDTAVDLNDAWLLGSYQNDEMTPSGPIAVSPPVISEGVSRIALSTTFTNNSGSEKTIREIGMLLRTSLWHTFSSGPSTENAYLMRDGTLGPAASYTALALGARDVINPILVQPSETFSIIYEIITSVEGNKSSGIMENFNELLYRQLSADTRAARDYFNTQTTLGTSRSQFRVPENDNGSFGNTFGYNRYNQGYFGIILGHTEGLVDADDYFLRDDENPPNDTLIPFGITTGSLIYHENRYVDFELTATTCYLVFERLVENKSGAPIEIKQIGLNVAAANDFNNPTLISRKNLGLDSFIIADGEKYRIRFKFGIEL